MKYSLLTFFYTILSFSLFSQSNKSAILKNLSEKETAYNAIASQIWTYAEMGYLEYKSADLLQKTLENEGFTIKKGIADIPTAFVAEYGSGKPIIGILGEYDALPGLSQDTVATRKSLGGKAGHACGHHLFGTASAAAAIAVKDWLRANKLNGTIRFYGCPAEEGGSGKVYLVRAGLFDEVDVALHWHPGAINTVTASKALANKSAKFRFYGIASHAAASPEEGRSALDAVEAMNQMVNMLREHVPSDTRIHYVITNGGKAPNVVPDFAEVYYYCRHPQRETLVEIWERIEKAAQGAAVGTGTRVETEIIGGTYELLPNITLNEVMYNNLQQVGGVKYTPNERAFAEQLYETLPTKTTDLQSVEQVFKEAPDVLSGSSTDVGDVSWAVPTVGLSTATWVANTPAHSWQAVAAGGTGIGQKGMMVAAKTLALTAADLFENQEIIEKAKKEFIERRGEKFLYVPLLGNRMPALDYRK